MLDFYEHLRHRIIAILFDAGGAAPLWTLCVGLPAGDYQIRQALAELEETGHVVVVRPDDDLAALPDDERWHAEDAFIEHPTARQIYVLSEDTWWAIDCHLPPT